MSFESRIKADGRRLLRSPVWTGIAVTFCLVMPTFVVPGIPLWVSLATLITTGPMIVLVCHLLYGVYGRQLGSEDTSTHVNEASSEVETPVDVLKRRYANGEIDTETYERRLEGVRNAEQRARRVESHEPLDELTVRNQ